MLGSNNEISLTIILSTTPYTPAIPMGCNRCVMVSNKDLNRNVRKHTFVHVRQTMILISLRLRTVWLESWLGAFRVPKNAKFRHAVNEGSDQIVLRRRLTWIIAGRTFSKVPFRTVRRFYIFI